MALLTQVEMDRINAASQQAIAMPGLANTYTQSMADAQQTPMMAMPPRAPYVPPFDPTLIPTVEQVFWTVVNDAAVRFDDMDKFRVEKITILLGDASKSPATQRSIPALLFSSEQDARGYMKHVVRERFRLKIDDMVKALTMAGLKDGLSDAPETKLCAALHHYLQEIAP